MITQVCKCCGVEKELSYFSKDNNRPNHRTTCKQCRTNSRDKEKSRERHRLYARERRKNFPDKVRQEYERCVYGKSKEDFTYSECWICKSTEKLCVDHDHTTGKARGLLCHYCNIGLGVFKDNIKSLEKAAKYLKISQE